MVRKLSIIFMLFLLSGFFIQSCGGSRKDDDEGLSEEELRQQQELDEIEALLGITPEQKPADTKKQKSPQEDEMLGLLSAEEVPVEGGSTVDKSKLKKMEKEISDLKSQLNEKDLIIADLKAQLSIQSEQMDQMESRRPAAGSFTFDEPVGDVEPGEYQARYQEAFDLFQAREYQGALQLFESLLAADANNSLADNAQFWIGESHYALRQYDKAIIDFEKVFTFPKSNKNDAAQFKLGLCYLRKGDKSKAREEFQRLLDLYPNSEYVSRAQKHLENL